jgi:hypothetical protein
MTTFALTIDSDNAAFDDGEGGRHEVVRLLGVALRNIKDGRNDQTLFDVNGNKVGSYVFEPSEIEE